VVGNESERHKRYKKRLADICRARGFRAIGDNDDEAYVFRNGDSFPYFLDVYASNGERDIAVEVDGYKGHNSRRRILRDKHRTNELKDIVYNLEVYRFAFFQLKGMDDETIALELGLKGGNN
jgi:hypothetical protein